MMHKRVNLHAIDEKVTVFFSLELYIHDIAKLETKMANKKNEIEL